MQIPVEEIVFGNPVFTIGLTFLCLYILHAQRNLSYREYRFFHILKCWAAFPLDSRVERNLVRNAPDEDFVMTVDENPRAVFKQLSDTFSPHLLATAKRRESGWAHSQLVQQHDEEKQTECYLFANGDGTTDVYGHYETSPKDPEGHVSDEQEHGDHLGAIEKTLTSDFA